MLNYQRVVSQKVDCSINLDPAIVLNTSGPVMISTGLPRTGSPCTGGSWREACHSASSRINLQHATEIFRHQMDVLMGKYWEIIYKFMFECENHLQIVFMISEDQSANFTGEEHPCTTGMYCPTGMLQAWSHDHSQMVSVRVRKKWKNHSKYGEMWGGQNKIHIYIYT